MFELLLLFIGIIVVALFIFHTNRKLYNDSKSKQPPRDRGSKLKGSPPSTLKSSLLARKDALAKSWRRS